MKSKILLVILILPALFVKAQMPTTIPRVFFFGVALNSVSKTAVFTRIEQASDYLNCTQVVYGYESKMRPFECLTNKFRLYLKKSLGSVDGYSFEVLVHDGNNGSSYASKAYNKDNIDYFNKSDIEYEMQLTKDNLTRQGWNVSAIPASLN